ncbi:hypothetical protein MIR68_004008 [Amoeboaphelidium protococcarum]|nr:hypothetical protein MIR68_004008 [Amoeboaphelidium protococcarum]
MTKEDMVEHVSKRQKSWHLECSTVDQLKYKLNISFDAWQHNQEYQKVASEWKKSLAQVSNGNDMIYFISKIIVEMITRDNDAIIIDICQCIGNLVLVEVVACWLESAPSEDAAPFTDSLFFCAYFSCCLGHNVNSIIQLVQQNQRLINDILLSGSIISKRRLLLSFYRLLVSQERMMLNFVPDWSSFVLRCSLEQDLECRVYLSLISQLFSPQLVSQLQYNGDDLEMKGSLERGLVKCAKSEIDRQSALQKLVSQSCDRSYLGVCNNVLYIGHNLVIIKNLSFASSQIKLDNFISTVTSLSNLESLGSAICKSRKPICIVGSSSSGKSLTIQYLASQLNQQVTVVHLNHLTDSKSLIGGQTMSESGSRLFEYKEGVLTRAARIGQWLVVEDVSMLSEDVVSLFFQVLHQGFVRIGPGVNDIVQCHFNFKVICTYPCQNGPGFVSELSSQVQFKDYQVLKFTEFSLDDTKLLLNEKFPVVSQQVIDWIIQGYSWLLSNHQTFTRQTEFFVVPGLSQLLYWCRRVYILLGDHDHNNSNGEVLSYESRVVIFASGFDVFLSSCPFSDSLLRLTVEFAQQIGVSEESVLYHMKQRIPDVQLNSQVIKVGYMQLQRRSSFSSTGNNRPMIALNTHAKKIVEQLVIGVHPSIKQPVLLVGETGCGKTTVVQFLSDCCGIKMTVINMSQQSEVSDLLGSYKPVDMKLHVALPIKELFDSVFRRTFSVKDNKKYLDACKLAWQQSAWKRLFQLWSMSLKMFAKKSAAQSSAIDHILLKDWGKFQSMVADFESKIAHLNSYTSSQQKLTFGFVEGALVKAIKQGEWVLLDEINLATAETLSCISSILDMDQQEVTIIESGEVQVIKRHPDFRIFGCMNPSTDVGKRPLPDSIRRRFFELCVGSPENNLAQSVCITNDSLQVDESCQDFQDLLMVISLKLQALLGVVDLSVPSDHLNLIKQVAKFYLHMRTLSQNRQLEIGEVSLEQPHYSTRSLSRALQCSLRFSSQFSTLRSLYEGLYLIFCAPLNQKSLGIAVSVLRKYLLPDSNSNALRLFLSKSGVKPQDCSNQDWICLYQLNVEKGVYRPDEQQAQFVDQYVVTKSVERNLRNLCSTLLSSIPVLIQGPTSAGKTSMIEYLAIQTGNKMVRINNHEHTDMQDYIGSYVWDGVAQNFVFKDGVLVQALRNGWWIVLDELNLAPSDVMEALNRLLDDNQELVIPETGEVVRPKDGFRLFATQNPAGLIYGGRKQLSRAFRNRFIELHFNDIPADELELILQKRCRIAPSYAKKMIKVYQDLQLHRSKSKLFNGKDGFMTLRDLFRWASRENSGGEQPIGDDGYMLLAERLRNEEEKLLVKKVLEQHFRCSIDPQLLYGQNQSLVNADGDHQLVLTSSMKRLYALVDRALQHNEPVLLVGVTGCGKTTVVQQYAKIHSQKLDIVNCHQNTESSDFVGGMRPVRNSSSQCDQDNQQQAKLFEWTDGPLVSTMKSGGIILLDEISLADDAVVERLNSVLESSRQITVMERNDCAEIYYIRAHDEFKFIATMNPGGDFGKKELSPALRNRFTEIWVDIDWSNVDDLRMILHSKLARAFGNNLSQLDDAVSLQMEIMSRLRSIESFSVSIREIILWCDFIRDNLSLQYDDHLKFVLEGYKLVFLDTISSQQGSVKQQYANVIAPFIDGIEPKYGLEHYDDSFFVASQARLNAIKIVRAMSFTKARAILLEGSPGCGKSSIVTTIGKLNNKQVVRINLSEQTDLIDLFGSDLPSDGGDNNDQPRFEWRDGPLLRAMKDGQWVLLDEMNLASQSVLEGLNALLDHRSTVYIPELDQYFECHAEFRLFAAQNPLSQGGGRKGLPASFLNRFIRIWIDDMDTEDYLSICRARYSGSIDDQLLVNLVQFNERLSTLCVSDINFGQLGYPWEFNLRDIFRCVDILKEYGTGALCDAIFLVYILRFRCEHDRSTVITLFEEIFGASAFVESSLVPSIDEHHFKVGVWSIDRLTRRSFSSGTPSIRYEQEFLRGLRALIQCSILDQMAILTSDDAAMCFDLIKNLALVSGSDLITVNLDRQTDPYDLVGIFEQNSISWRIDQFHAVVNQSYGSPLSESVDQLIVLAKNSHKEWLNLAKKIAECSTDGDQVLMSSLLQGIERLIDGQVQFVWRDGPLVQAMQNGHWLYLNNANICNPSVLDRLNSVMEEDGCLVVSEQGIVNGGVRCIQRHPQFRLILGVDVNYRCELSRAMRNRGVEIFLPSDQVSRGLWSAVSTTFSPLEYQLACAQIMKSLNASVFNYWEIMHLQNTLEGFPLFNAVIDECGLPVKAQSPILVDYALCRLQASANDSVSQYKYLDHLVKRAIDQFSYSFKSISLSELQFVMRQIYFLLVDLCDFVRCEAKQADWIQLVHVLYMAVEHLKLGESSAQVAYIDTAVVNKFLSVCGLYNLSDKLSAQVSSLARQFQTQSKLASVDKIWDLWQSLANSDGLSSDLRHVKSLVLQEVFSQRQDLATTLKQYLVDHKTSNIKLMQIITQQCYTLNGALNLSDGFFCARLFDLLQSVNHVQFSGVKSALQHLHQVREFYAQIEPEEFMQNAMLKLLGDWSAVHPDGLIDVTASSAQSSNWLKLAERWYDSFVIDNVYDPMNRMSGELAILSVERRDMEADLKLSSYITEQLTGGQQSPLTLFLEQKLSHLKRTYDELYGRFPPRVATQKFYALHQELKMFRNTLSLQKIMSVSDANLLEQLLDGIYQFQSRLATSYVEYMDIVLPVQTILCMFYIGITYRLKEMRSPVVRDSSKYILPSWRVYFSAQPGKVVDMASGAWTYAFTQCRVFYRQYGVIPEEFVSRLIGYADQRIQMEKKNALLSETKDSLYKFSDEVVDYLTQSNSKGTDQQWYFDDEGELVMQEVQSDDNTAQCSNEALSVSSMAKMFLSIFSDTRNSDLRDMTLQGLDLISEELFGSSKSQSCAIDIELQPLMLYTIDRKIKILSKVDQDCSLVINKLQKLIDRCQELITLWPENPILVQILKIADRIQGFDSAQSLAKIVGGLELLLVKLQEWQDYASKELSLQSFLDDISQYVLQYRREQISKWLDALQLNERQWVEADFDKWHHLAFNLLSPFDDSLSEQSYLAGSYDNLIQYVKSSQAGRFGTKLSMLKAFARVNALMGRQSVAIMIQSAVDQFAIFLPECQLLIQSKMEKYKKEIKDIARLTSWKDINYFNLKSYVDASCRKINKVIHNYINEVLSVPVAKVIEQYNMRMQYLVLDRMKDCHLISPIVLPLALHASQAQQSSEWQIDLGSVNQSSQALIRKIDRVGARIVQSLPQVDGIQSLNDEILDHLRNFKQMNKDLESTGPTADNISQIKNLRKMKENALNRLLKVLKGAGLKTVERLDPQSLMKVGVQQSLLDVDSCQQLSRLLHENVAAFTAMQDQLGTCHQQVSKDQMSQFTSLIESLLCKAVSGWISLNQCAVQSLQSVDQVCKYLQFCASNNDLVILDGPVDLSRLLCVAKSLQVVLMQMAVVNDGEEAWKAYIGTLDSIVDQLSKCPTLSQDVSVASQLHYQIGQQLMSLLSSTDPGHNQRLRNVIQESQNEVREVLSYFSTSSCNQMTEDAASTSKVIEGILLFVQRVSSSVDNEDATSEEIIDDSIPLVKGYFNISAQQQHATFNKLHSSQMDDMINGVLLWSNLESITRVLPFIFSLQSLVSKVFNQSASSLVESMRLCGILIHVNTLLIQKGFCLSEELADADAGDDNAVDDKAQLDGTGMAAGEKGDRDVSDEIEDEEQVLGLKDEINDNEKEQSDDDDDDDDDQEQQDKDEDEGLDMQNDFDGQFESMQRNEEDDQEDERDQDDLDEQMGNTADDKDDLDDQEVLDEKMWNNDDEDEDQEEQEERTQEGVSKGDGQADDSNIAAAEDEMSGEQNEDLVADQSKQDNPEVNEQVDEDDMVDRPQQQRDNESSNDVDNDQELEQQDQEDGDLPENMQLDDVEDAGQQSEQDHQQEDDCQDDVLDVEESPEENGEDQDGEEDSLVNPMAEQDSTNGDEDESAQDQPQYETDGKDETVLDQQQMLNDEVQYGIDGVDGNQSQISRQQDEFDVVSEDKQQDTKEDQSHNPSQSLASDSKQSNQSSLQTQIGDLQQEKGREANANRKLAAMNSKVDFKNVTDASADDKQNTPQSSGLDAQQNQMQVKFVQDDVDTDLQAQGVATKDQMDQAKQMVVENPEEDGDQDDQVVVDQDEGDDQMNVEEDLSLESDEILLSGQVQSRNKKAKLRDDTEQDESLTDCNDLMSVDEEPSVDAAFYSEQHQSENQLSSEVKLLDLSAQSPSAVLDDQEIAQLYSNHSIDMKSRINASSQVWNDCLQRTSSLSTQLCEKLRLILEPNVNSHLRGDYKTGKRLNMRKIIPYIASQYRKDKIWLRRTKPQKRSYQVLIAVDDSKSMADGKCIRLAFESLALISRALTLLEVGQVGVASFGESVRMIHPFDAPLSSGIASGDANGGANMISQFTFNQDKTIVGQLLSQSVSMLRQQRMGSRGGSGQDLWQLQIIISDGICEDHQNIRQMVRQATVNDKIMTLFIVLDMDKSTQNQAGGKYQQLQSSDPSTQRQHSIMDMKNVSFDANGQLKMTKYMDTFPFDFYIVLRDLDSLPSILSEALSQWFEMASRQ